MVTWKLLAVGFGTAGVLGIIAAWQLVAGARLRRRLAEVLGRARPPLPERVAHPAVPRPRPGTAERAHDRLRSELAALETPGDDVLCGFYDPVFTFASSADYKQRLIAVRDAQKAMVREDRAVRCGTEWVAPGGRLDRARLQQARLLVRAFNGECEAVIARLRWNNATPMIERINHAFASINRLGAAMQLELTTPYRALKLEELRLEHEYQQKQRAEQEERRASRARTAELVRLDHSDGDDEDTRPQRAVDMTLN